MTDLLCFSLASSFIYVRVACRPKAFRTISIFKVEFAFFCYCLQWLLMRIYNVPLCKFIAVRIDGEKGQQKFRIWKDFASPYSRIKAGKRWNSGWLWDQTFRADRVGITQYKHRRVQGVWHQGMMLTRSIRPPIHLGSSGKSRSFSSTYSWGCWARFLLWNSTTQDIQWADRARFLYSCRPREADAASWPVAPIRLIIVSPDSCNGYVPVNWVDVMTLISCLVSCYFCLFQVQYSTVHL